MHDTAPTTPQPDAPATSCPAVHGTPPARVRTYSTDELAALLKVKGQTVRAGYCRDGHYQSLVPIKARNRYLLWPADAADRIAAGKV